MLSYKQKKAEIIHFTEKMCGMPYPMILTASRKQPNVDARKLLSYLLRTRLGMSYSSVADEIGRDDHTTAMHHIRTFPVDTFVEKNPGALEELDKKLFSP